MCDKQEMGSFPSFMYKMMHHGPMKMGMMCGPGYGHSKETRVKQLEALKSQLQDQINHIDGKISELETDEKVEA